MKTFFGNLFGKKARETPKRVPPAARVLSEPPRFELYKKGDVIGGKYYVHGILGAGGFGVVLLVSERGTNEFRALKTFRDEFLRDPATREAFKKEALLWINLDEHPCILTARWIEIFSNRLFVMMDYVEPDSEGRVSLADHLHSQKPIPEARATEWAIQFCMGMEHATSHGVRCHRDIKPANILIGKDGNLKIADFGLAAVQHELTNREQLMAELCEEAEMELIVERTKEREQLFVSRGKDGAFGFSVVQKGARMLSGTPGYIAPEVYRGEPADLKADIYAFGLVFWQVATSSVKPPFVGAMEGDVHQFMQKAYERQISGKLPPIIHPLQSILRRCLHPQPAERYSTFREIHNDLRVGLP